MDKIYSMHERVSALEVKIKLLEGKIMNRKQKTLENDVINELKIVEDLSARLLEIRDILHSEEVDDLNVVRTGIHDTLVKAIGKLKEIDK